MTEKKPHPHAALMAMYAQDAAETDKPWERWQWRDPKSKTRIWYCCLKDDEDDAPRWYINIEYRRKPRTININGYEVPKPLRDAPIKNSKYWIASITDADGSDSILNGSLEIRWDGDSSDLLWLKNGLCHSTKEAAELHSEALLSFTREDRNENG
jgi:hypothetical protein